jgi:hypothetical protein
MPEVAPAEEELRDPDSPESNQEDNQFSPFREEGSSSGERGPGLPLGTKGERPPKNGSRPPEPLVPGDAKSQPKAAVPELGGSAAPTADLVINLSWLEDVDTGAMDEPKQRLTEEREEQQVSPASAQHHKSIQGDEPGLLAILEAMRMSLSYAAPDSPVAQARSLPARVGQSEIDTQRDRRHDDRPQTPKQPRLPPNMVRHLRKPEEFRAYLPYQARGSGRLGATVRSAEPKAAQLSGERLSQ